MVNPNELAEPLEINRSESRFGYADDSLCAVRFEDRRLTDRRKPLNRPVCITLAGTGFEAAFNASYEDMEAMRDWLSTAMAAIEAQNAAEAA